MFQYTHEMIFNSLTMPDGSARVVAPVNDDKEKHGLVIKRGGEYWKEFIQDQGADKHVVYRTDGNFGTYEVLKLDVTMLPQAVGTYQLSMFIKLLDPHALFDYGYPQYRDFGKHYLIGFDRLPGEEDADIAKKIYESLRYAIDKEYAIVGGIEGEGEDAKVVEFTEGSTKIGIRASHFAERFDTVALAFYDETMCDSCIGEYLPSMDILNNEDENKNAAEVVVAGVEPFATGEWLQENHRFPTYPNIRYHAPGYEDYPIPGVKYVQFSFAYQSPRPQLGGLSGVGQAMMAITRHIYFVPETLADQFEGYFSDMGCTIVKSSEVEVTNPDANAVEGNPTQPQP